MKSGGQESQFRNKKNNWWRDTELMNHRMQIRCDLLHGKLNSNHFFFRGDGQRLVNLNRLLTKLARRLGSRFGSRFQCYRCMWHRLF
jgi:hypothetical protein